MIETSDLRLVKAGVVYSPGGAGWQYYPENRLFVGITADAASPTHVRTLLQFAQPGLEQETILIRAFLRLHVIENRPAEVSKLVWLREPPAESPWTLAAEADQAVLGEQRLAGEDGVDLLFDLTDLVDAWRHGAPNRGILLGLGESKTGLLTLGNALPNEPGPILRLVHARRVPGTAAAILKVAPESGLTSPEYPASPMLIKNLGPGTAWITPLYRFKRGGPLYPDGIPLGVLSSGEYLSAKPERSALDVSIQVVAAAQEVKILLVPLED